MTLDQLIDALWEARATIALKDGHPVLQGVKRDDLRADVLVSLREHREAIIFHLQHGTTQSARLQGLVCGTCAKLPQPEKMTLFWCVACGWATHHHPREAAKA